MAYRPRSRACGVRTARLDRCHSVGNSSSVDLPFGSSRFRAPHRFRHASRVATIGMPASRPLQARRPVCTCSRCARRPSPRSTAATLDVLSGGRPSSRAWASRTPRVRGVLRPRPRERGARVSGIVVCVRSARYSYIVLAALYRFRGRIVPSRCSSPSRRLKRDARGSWRALPSGRHVGYVEDAEGCSSAALRADVTRSGERVAGMVAGSDPNDHRGARFSHARCPLTEESHDG